MNMKIKPKPTTHHCELKKGSDSCLPKLPPQAGTLRRIWRVLRKKLIVSRVNPKCKMFLRSTAAVMAEKKRHIRSKNWYIIHPFSRFCIYREVIMSITWFIVFFKDPFITAYYIQVVDISTHIPFAVFELFLDFILWLNIITCFFTGYFIPKTKEIILEPKRITFTYLTSYFIFDLIGALPVGYITYNLYEVHHHRTVLWLTRFTTFARLRTMLEYFRQITQKLGDTAHDLICLILMTICFVHIWACMVYLTPTMYYKYLGSLDEDSWVLQAQIELVRNETVAKIYLECLHIVVCHFYLSGGGMYLIREPVEQFLFTSILVMGFIYYAYLVVMVFEVTGSANASESKYEEIMYQLKEYMRTKKLPIGLRKRLVLFYENKFQKHYFREQAILATLSEHLRHELFLHCCKALVEKVGLFQGMSKSIVGTVVACLKQEVFLPNDVILTAGTTAEAMYFISYGTVAIMLPNGKEVCFTIYYRWYVSRIYLVKSL